MIQTDRESFSSKFAEIAGEISFPLIVWCVVWALVANFISRAVS